MMFEDILKRYKKGKISEEEVKEKMLKLFYNESDNFLIDIEREERLGFPEIIWGAEKDIDSLIDIVENILERNDIVFLSDLNEDKIQFLEDKFSSYIMRKTERMLVIKNQGYERENIGKVGVITGGSSDVQYAEDCSLILEELGVDTIKSYDRGISGIHRPFLSSKDTKEADVLIVFAGMDGVLPGLIASSTEKPIIGVPVPVGYGHGEKGEGALTTMLQSCVPGLTVVNIGNFVGAAAAAIRILKSIKD